MNKMCDHHQNEHLSTAVCIVFGMTKNRGYIKIVFFLAYPKHVQFLRFWDTERASL